MSQERTKFENENKRKDDTAGKHTFVPCGAVGNVQQKFCERFLRAWQGGGWPYSLHDFLGKMSQGLRKKWPKWPSPEGLEENCTPRWEGGLSQRVLTRVAAHPWCAWKVRGPGEILET